MSTEEKKTDNNDIENTPLMSLSRRRFCQLAGATVAAIALGRYVGFDLAQRAAAYPVSPGLTKFTETLRGVGPGGIPVALPDSTPAPGTGAVHYTLKIGQYTDTLHSSFGPNSTTLWGYSPAVALGENAYPTRHLGGIIVAEKGVPIQITFTNELPATHILPVDPTIMGVVAGHHNRAAVHLHGGLVPWISDGGPFSWFGSSVAPSTPNYGPSVPAGTKGNIYKNLNASLANNQAEYYYPNNQSARLEWYHDHAIGLTRLNAYAGIASAYIIRDDFERSLIPSGLPNFVELGGNEIPIVFQDKLFKSTGELDYPSSYEARWGSWTGPGFIDPITLPDPSVVPEVFGDTMLVNGVVHPKAPVEARRYRLRILNACGARFLNLQLYEEDTANPGQPNLNLKGPDFLVIGTEGGFLPNPVLIPSNNPIVFTPGTNDVADVTNPAGAGKLALLTAPAERWDIIIDFNGYAGKNLILYNDAPAPYPGGAGILTDFIGTGNNANTRNIMRFEVSASTLPSDPDISITPATDLTTGLDPFLVSPGSMSLPAGTKVRKLTLNEVYDEHGRLIQMLGTNAPTDLPPGYHSDPTFDNNYYARAYEDMVDTANPITEKPTAGNIEIWEIANLTMDTHPMHFHLVNVQVLKRQAMVIDPLTLTYEYTNGVPNFGTNTARAPEPTELGWKETVKMNPGEVTTIIMKFDLPTVPVEVPQSPRTGGHEYVWHCHILEHEEHDMMRPLVVQVSPTPPPPVPELPTAILTAVGTVAALGLAGKMKNDNKDEDKK